MSKVKICLIGIDGSGKTSHLLALKLRLESMELHCKQICSRGNYFRFLSLPFLYIFRLLGCEDTFTFRGRKYRTRHLSSKYKNTSISRLWTLLFLMDTYILLIMRGYFFSRADITLCDRSTTDSIIDLMATLKSSVIYHGRTVRFFLSLTWPDVVLLLDVDEDKAFQRKTDIPNLEYLRSRRILYHKMASDLGIPIIDTGRPFTMAHLDIVNHLKNIVYQRLAVSISNTPQTKNMAYTLEYEDSAPK